MGQPQKAVDRPYGHLANLDAPIQLARCGRRGHRAAQPAGAGSIVEYALLRERIVLAPICQELAEGYGGGFARPRTPTGGWEPVEIGAIHRYGIEVEW